MSTNAHAHGATIDVILKSRNNSSAMSRAQVDERNGGTISNATSQAAAWDPDTDPAFQKALRDRLMSNEDSIFFSARLMDTAKNNTVYGLQDPCTGTTSNTNPVLAPGATVSCTASAVATVGLYVNTGTAAGTGYSGSAVTPVGSVTATDKAHYNVRKAKADADYEVAKEKCDDLSGNAKDVCKKDAKAAHVTAVENAKVAQAQAKPADTAAEKKADVAEAKKDAAEEKREANYKAAKERCDTLSGDAQSKCVDDAKRMYAQ